MPPRKILAIKFRSLGDTVLMTAPLAELKRAHPNAELHVACLRQWSPLLEGHPAIARIWPYDRYEHVASRTKAIARMALELRRERYDVVVNFHASPSSATLAFATGAPVRSIHFHGHKDKNRHSTVEVPGKGTLKPIIERDMDAVRALGIAVPEGKLPELTLEREAIDSASQNLLKMGLKPPLLAIGLGSSRPAKSWPLERFAGAARQWVKRTSGSVLALAGPGEEKLRDEFVSFVSNEPKIRCLSNVQLRKLAAILARSALFLGNDSGPKHMAVAVGIPTVTLFGPEHPFEWHPYPKERHPYFFLESLTCRKDADPGMPPWCGLEVCVAEGHRCMKEIGVDEVFEQCMKVAKL